MIKLFALVFIFLSTSVFGQEYLVTIQGDTMKGVIKPISFQKIDQVKLIQNKTKKTYTAMQVKMYSYKGDLYAPIQYDNAIRFMKLLKPGYLSLYAFRLENQNTLDGRLLVKMDGSKLEVPNINFKKPMANFLAECNQVREKLMSGDLGRKDIDKIIDQFNACFEKQAESIQKSIAVSEAAGEKIEPLQKLEKTIESLPDLDSKKDALDLIHDMIDKIKSDKTIPNYQIEALKSMLQGKAETKDDLAKVIAVLKP